MGAKTSLRYHLILTTRCRRSAQSATEQQVYAAFRDVAAHSPFQIMTMSIEDGNHIHPAIKMSPKYSVSSMVNRMKAMTHSSASGRLRRITSATILGVIDENYGMGPTIAQLSALYPQTPYWNTSPTKTDPQQSDDRDSSAQLKPRRFLAGLAKQEEHHVSH